MKQLFALFAILCMSMFAHAGVMVTQGGGSGNPSKVGLVTTIQCGVGISCTKQSDTAVLRYNGALPAITATATTITLAQCGNTFTNTGAVLMNLPLAVSSPGCELTFVTGNASNFDINPQNTDQILQLTDAAGDSIRNATLGNSIKLKVINGTKWAVIAINGTYSDIN